MWASAQEYYEMIIHNARGLHFGDKGSICPLCHQIIDNESQKRFTSVNEYVNGSLANTYDKLQEEFKNTIILLTHREFNSTKVKELLFEVIDGTELEIIAQLYKYLEQIQSNSDADYVIGIVESIHFDEAISNLKKVSESMDSEIASLNQALNGTERLLIQEELSKLECNKWCFENISTIERVIENLKKLLLLMKQRNY